MADYLDVDLAIAEVDPVTKEIKATPYFEDYLYKIIETLGGEGGTVTGDSFDLSSYPPDLAAVSAQVNVLKSKIDNLEKSTEVSKLLSLINNITIRLNDLEHTEPVSLTAIFQRLDEFEKQFQPINLTKIFQRLDDLEKQL